MNEHDNNSKDLSLLDYLLALEWKQKLPASLDPGAPLLTPLSQWCSRRWLKETNVDQFTSLLTSRLAQQTPPVDAVLLHTDFFCALYALYQNCHKSYSQMR